jgi:FkbM family methyltransferase
LKRIYPFVRFENTWKNLWKAKIERYLSRANSLFYQERGHKMAVYANDFISVKIFTEGVFERLQLETLMEFLNLVSENSTKEMTVLDIGANIGNHSLFFSRQFNRVFSFEPHPFTYHLLTFNAQFASNIKTFNFGLGHADASLDLYENTINFGASSTVYQSDLQNQKVKIQVKRLDDCRQEFGSVDLMKIDVEGMEHSVLLGALDVIKDQKPIILLEQLVQEFPSDGTETKSIQLLRDLDYRICWIEKQRRSFEWSFIDISNLINIFKEKKVIYHLVMKDPVPRATYDMLIAIPPKYIPAVQKLLDQNHPQQSSGNNRESFP